MKKMITPKKRQRKAKTASDLIKKKRERCTVWMKRLQSGLEWGEKARGVEERSFCSNQTYMQACSKEIFKVLYLEN